MKAKDIAIGSTLILKSERQQAYGLESPLVTVHHFQERPHYSVPFVVALRPEGAERLVSGEYDYFRPQDFKSIA